MIYTLLDHILDFLENAKNGVTSWGHRVANIGRDSFQWVNHNRTDLLHLFTSLIVAVLLIGFIHQQNQQRQLAASNSTLIRGETTIIKNQSKQIDEQKTEIAALSTHVDCLFALATNPSKKAFIANPADCMIAVPAANPTSSATTAQNPPLNKTNSGQTGATTTPQTTNSGNGQGTPPAQHCTVKLFSFCL